jgi:plastocyanin
MMRRSLRIPAFLSLAALAACGGGEKKPAENAAPAAPPGPATPCPTCKVIEVTVTTDATGNYFTPKDFEAHEGDIMRVKLVVGVHNVHFLADSNPGKSNLPAASEMLQLPGQTIDIPLNFGKGKFYFQCDPHAALGMKGHVKIE